MSVWTVYGTEEIYVAVEVEADTEEEAMQKFERGHFADKLERLEQIRLSADSAEFNQ